MKRHWVWNSLVVGHLKVNVDSLGKRGIKSVFRNLDGRVLIQFGKEVSVNSAIHAELLALREGIFVTSK